VLCSTAPAGGGFPLVSLTYDMGWKADAPAHVRTLEIVTGPIAAADGATWEKARAFIETFFRRLEDKCATSTAKTVGGYCAVSVDDMLSGWIDATTDCYPGKPEKNLKSEARKLVLFAAPTTASAIDRSVIEAHTQVSIGLDLEKLASVDLSELFGWKTMPGALAYAYFQKTMKPQLASLSALEQGVAMVDAMSVKVFVSYFLKKFVEQDSRLGEMAARWDAYRLEDRNWFLGEFKNWVRAYQITDADWSFKNLFSLMPKASLFDFFGSVRNSWNGPGFPKWMADHLPSRLVCSDELFPTPVERAACQELYWWIFDESLVGTDVFHLKEVSYPIDVFSNPGDGKLRAVFEMRGDTAIIATLKLVAAHDAAGKIHIGFAGKTLGIPDGLP
jgi:hypothetical protein